MASLRPNLTRVQSGSTSHILSYYQSALADGSQQPVPIEPTAAATSTIQPDSGSEYSDTDSHSDYGSPQTTKRLRPSPSLRRIDTLSKGASDRRRLAVVEMESPSTSAPSQTLTAKHSRYASEHGGSLALVAPPDAYTMKSPSASESSTPRTGELPSLLPPPFMTRRSTGQSVVTPGIGEGKDSSAPVASPIVSYLDYKIGRDSTAGPLPEPPRSPPMSPTSASPSLPPPTPPVRSSARAKDKIKQALQLPPAVSAKLATRSHSPLRDEITSPLSPSTHRREGAISPTVISLESAPSPPTEFNAPPVPAPEMISAASSQQSTNSQAPAEDGWISVSSDNEGHPKGSFAKRLSHEISTHSQTPSRASNEFSSSSHSSHYSASHTGMTPSPPPKSLRSSITKGLRRMSMNHSRSSIERAKSPPPLPPLPVVDAALLVSPPRGSSLHPLPQLPSQPLPLRNIHNVPRQHRAPRQKTIARAPPALFCHEVWSEKNATVRCEIYAAKINELWQTDCGLTDWLHDVTTAGPSKPIIIQTEAEEVEFMRDFEPQPRHTSHGSEVSEMTFPRRPDATTATDITAKYEPYEPEGKETGGERAVASLPYPALAKVSSPSSGYSSSSSTTSGGFLAASKAGVFFASLGRKASVNTGATQNPHVLKGRLTKKPAQLPPVKAMISSPSSPHTISSPSSPSKSNLQLIPGGPRGPSKRVERSRTLMPQTSFNQPVEIIDRKHGSTATDDGEEEDLVLIRRSPSTGESSPPSSKLTRNRTSYQPSSSYHSHQPQKSLVPIPQSLPSTPPLREDEFEEQLVRLGDLLPHVERNVLATYLRRAGQDVKAVGLYIADEQAGRIRS